MEFQLAEPPKMGVRPGIMNVYYICINILNLVDGLVGTHHAERLVLTQKFVQKKPVTDFRYPRAETQPTAICNVESTRVPSITEVKQH
jgi:hypothetical protein